MPDKSKRYGFLPSGGLYEPSREHDSCGIGFIAHMKGEKSHSIIQDGIEILRSLEHRGAVGADPKAGDGAGLLLQMPDKFLRKACDKQGFSLPKEGEYGCGIFFLPRDKKALYAINEIITKSIKDEGHKLIGWRDVAIDNSSLGESVKASEPFSSMIFIENGKKELDQNGFERSLFVIRRVIENKLAQADIPYTDKFFHINSLSSRILLYKGMLLSAQLDSYFLDLQDKDMVSALALVHQRFSTNTFPSWKLAQPFRMICHNGEINTLRGNINWMAARHATLKSPLFGEDIEKLWPLIQEGQSDSACFDNALELLVQGGYPLAHAMMLLIPEAWEDNPIMSKELIAFYEHHAALMEPWDGPAAIAFTNGRQIGATLDRNGLRPARYYITKEDKIILASEAGTLPVKEEDVIHKWRLQPGKMLLIDLEQGRLIQDKEIKAELSKARPYRQWLEKGQIRVLDLPEVEHEPHISSASLLDRQQAFGYSEEDIKFLLSPMAENGEEATGSMGTDTPLPALSDKGKLLYYYFKQNFAQVTNPPIDPIREELVMSLVSLIGPRPNLLDREHGPDLKRLELTQPIITPRGIEKIRNIGQRKDTHFDTETLDSTWDAQSGFKGLISRMEALYQQSEKAIANGKNILIISDRALCKERIAIPALLATAGLHHHLIRKGLRTSVGLVVETGEAREVHHIACLAGYGAEGINPYLAFETLSQYYDPLESEKNYIKAVGKGLRKVMSKMGISTYQSYCGAQIFDAVGLKQSFIDQYFTGTHSKIEGVGLEEIAHETIARHKRAFGDDEVLREALPIGGEYAYRIRGEQHAWNSDTVRNLQHSVRSNSQEDYDNFSTAINKQDESLLTLRGLFRLKKAKKPIDLAKVEKAEEIVKRFSTGAMSFGSISREAHTTLAIAMNRIGGRSNTGEGGEQSDRFRPLANGDSMRSSIKQIASGRFGVTAEYLVNSDMIQIKMAQGAKPGEGGQLPGHKVDETIAKTRHSTPGVGLISPPPHHDIYSIEDLAQLIFDLKNVQPEAAISVKLVSEIGVGTVAAGVAKARADHVTISGFEGGTGASPLTSIKHAGSPWEIGLAETHQTLVLNKLRTRIRVQVDGGLRTGRDVIIGALLGADEFGFATAPLIATGCIMMRKCHLNTCPVGIATQNEVLRKRFTGTPEHVINYFFFVAEETRKIMAELGIARFDDLIGQSNLLDTKKAIDHAKASGLDFSKLFEKMDSKGEPSHQCKAQEHPIFDILDRVLIKAAKPALEKKKAVTIESKINNQNRSTGTMLSGELAKRHGHEGLSEDMISVRFEGTAGQSFGAFLAKGISFMLEGEANDYVGKGLSGGRISVTPPKNSQLIPEENIIIGNTVLYGAVSGECYFRGIAGERFAVRNSGAIAVIEGTGDHCCEYMTGGIIAVLGRTGRNFAAGMSGGIAYVFDEDGGFTKKCNQSMVRLLEIKHDMGNHLTRLDEHMNQYDSERLYKLIERHNHYTNSARGKAILEDWENNLKKFIKVMPKEYERVLEQDMKKKPLSQAQEARG